MLEIRLRQAGNCVVLDLSGRIDVDSANLVEAVGQCVRDGYPDILCNLEDVRSIDYMGISVVVIAYKEVLNHGGRMKIANLPAQLKDVFSVSGVDRSIEVYATIDAALSSFKEDRVIEGIKKMPLRRRFKRLPIDLKVEMKSDRGGGPECLKVEMLNLSAVGAFIFGCGNFKLGDEVILKMKLSPNPELLELQARVVWIPDKAVQPHEYPGVGVEFSNLSSENQQRIIDFIERNISSMLSD
ncbi:MAG: anti-sigma factor antagonist [Candidatus Omnitrophica bacterium]|jgi:anti-anti-sigma factor|nr:anti-sigma factor antagonist [Candidatus Omnitrophota bacterium]MDD5078155.1 anti-sigma factor antagonist [Candidatus Omnitrophota bacterium]